MALIDAAFWFQIALACGNGADPRLIVAEIEHESGGMANAVHVNRNGTVDRGAMQINSGNWERFGLTEQSAMDPCRSVDAGSRHLIADGGPDAVKPETVDALLRAIGKYNPGDPTYKDKIVGIMARNANMPAISTQSTAISTPTYRRPVAVIIGRPSSQRSLSQGK